MSVEPEPELRARLVDQIVAERDRYKAALIRIADAESGRWGWIAHDALHPERPPHDTHGTG